MNAWANFIGYQAVWFCVVFAAGRGLAWPGVAAAALFIAWQLAVSPRRGVELRLLLLAVALGIVVDGVMAWHHWSEYSAPWPSRMFAPIWILALWGAFSQTVTQSLAFLQRRAWIAFVFGAIGGPLAYLGASRGFDAVTLIAPDARGLAWLALAWGIAITLLSRGARHWTAHAQRRQAAWIGASP